MTQIERIFVCTPDERQAHAVAAALARVDRELLPVADVRAIRDFAARGPVAAALLHEGLGAPGADAIAIALRRALGEHTALLLLTDAVRRLPAGSPFDASIRVDAPAIVLAERVDAAVGTREARTSETRDLMVEIELRVARLGDASDHELLGIPEGSPNHVVTEAWDRLSLRLHPDRLRHLPDPELRDRAMDLYTRTSEAARRLRSGGRGSHPTSSGGMSAVPRSLEELSEDPASRRFLRTAQSAVLAGDLDAALLQLRFVASREPTNTALAARLQELERRRGP